MKKSKMKPLFAIVGISVLLLTAVLAMAAGVANAGSATATRTLPAEPVSAGESFTVRIEVSDYGMFGSIYETLPEGFIYVTSTLDPGSVKVAINTVKFILFGETSFAYTVALRPDVEGGTYTFSGILVDMNKKEYGIGGDTEIVIGEGGKEVTIVAPNITAWRPIEAVVNDAEGESRTFNIRVNQTVDISWQINGTEVQTNESVTEAAYTNMSAVGTWNISAIATNTTTGLSDMHTWIWRVTLTPTPAPLGFEAGFTFASIFAVAYLLLHRKKGYSEG
ncbi:MAG: hypothetical protein QMD80_03675 [archaeon]|nr:hypothetical protein [archaeon]